MLSNLDMLRQRQHALRDRPTPASGWPVNACNEILYSSLPLSDGSVQRIRIIEFFRSP